MSSILGLRFRENGQLYYYDAEEHQVRIGQHVLVKSEHGTAMAQVSTIQDQLPQGIDPADLKPILRPADDEDLVQHAENRALAREAARHCRHCINERNLDMKLVDVEIIQDRSKMIFYFTAPGRIDFRELVKDLVKAYRTRIELRQIGVRHETQMLGAIGNCGQMCCCARFIRKFQPVTIKMAKEQNLFLNPAKISGMCGRLLCCLAYEQGAYEEFQRRCPKIGKKFMTSQGAMKVLRSNLFRETLFVYTEGGEEKELSLDEWREIAGETPTPYIPPQQQPQQRPPQQRQPHAAPRNQEPPAPPSGDDGVAMAEGHPEDADGPADGSAPSRPKRKRKRKPRSRRPEGGPAPTSEPGE